MCSFVRSFLCLFLCSLVTLASFSSLWPAFTLTVHTNALYNESVHGRKEHATWINSIPLKNCYFIDFTNFEVGLYFRDRCAHCIHDESPLFGSQTPGAPDVSARDNFDTECRSKRQFGSQFFLLLTSFITV